MKHPFVITSKKQFVNIYTDWIYRTTQAFRNQRLRPTKIFMNKEDWDDILAWSNENKVK